MIPIKGDLFLSFFKNLWEVIVLRINIDIGERFGKLTVVSEYGRSNKCEILWLCSCDCGGEFIAKGYALRKGAHSTCTKCPPTNEYKIKGDVVYGSICNFRDFIIDVEDLDLVKIYQWHVADPGYIVTLFKGKTLKMHRLIMNARKGMSIDHINGKPWDNRKENLRECRHQQNMWNMKKPKTNKTGYKGVTQRSGYSKYIATIKINYENKHLGCFERKIDAAMAYDKAAIKYMGKYARLNFPINEKKEDLKTYG